MPRQNITYAPYLLAAALQRYKCSRMDGLDCGAYKQVDRLAGENCSGADLKVVIVHRQSHFRARIDNSKISVCRIIIHRMPRHV